MTLTAGDRLGAYEIESSLGAGGMGEVYRAIDPRLDRRVAVKVLSDRLASDLEYRERFQREAKAIAALSHPNILTIFDVGSDQGTAYAITELLDGQTLAEVIKTQGRLEWRRALDIGLAIASGLAAAHAKGIVHRDIKPANIFVTASGAIKILDFGLAKSGAAELTDGSDSAETRPYVNAAHDSTSPGAIIGTIGYMSPEQAKGQAATTRSDVFSLGCVLYEMLTAVRPFVRDTATETLASILKDDPPPVSQSAKDVPPALERIVRRALQKDPAARYPTADALRDDLADCQRQLAEPASASSFVGLMRKPVVLVAVVGLAALIAAIAFWSTRRISNQQWARDELVPSVMRLIEDGNYDAAFAAATEAAEYLPGDPILERLWPKMSSRVSVHTSPAGAVVSYKEYDDVDGPWIALGRSNLDDMRLPWSKFRWRIEKDGFAPIELASAVAPEVFALHRGNDIRVTLDTAENCPPGMIPVEGGTYGTPAIPLTGIPPLRPVELSRYFIDRTEVTNRQYKEFVDAGGYAREEFWQHPFEHDGKTLAFKDAVEQFVDTTGRPGPAMWELGNYPKGQDDYPVGGVSWFEAAAYAQFRQKRLPTVFHWIAAALADSEIGVPLSPSIIPLSNFGDDGPAAVGTHEGIGVSGARDMAGNLREWCFNATGDRRYSLGGAWNEPVYMFTLAQARSPWDRSANDGFRCALYDGGSEGDTPLSEPIDLPVPDFYAVTPMSDQAFAFASQLNDYRPSPLNAKVQPQDGVHRPWSVETVTVDAVYGGEQITIHMALPKSSAPLQAVVVFPGIDATLPRPFTDEYIDRNDFIMHSGRALILPVYADMYERSEGRTAERLADGQAARGLISEWGKDLSRVIDYLDTRADIQSDKLGYFGISLGATVAPILLSVEPRFSAAVLMSGGFNAVNPQSSVSFAKRTTLPILMLNGKYDYIFPLETHQKPLFDLLGTPAADKRHVLYEAGHWPLPRGKIIKEIVDWYDRYLGPVGSKAE